MNVTRNCTIPGMHLKSSIICLPRAIDSLLAAHCKPIWNTWLSVLHQPPCFGRSPCFTLGRSRASLSRTPDAKSVCASNPSPYLITLLHAMISYFGCELHALALIRCSILIDNIDMLARAYAPALVQLSWWFLVDHMFVLMRTSGERRTQLAACITRMRMGDRVDME